MADTESDDAFKLVCKAVRNEQVVFWAGAGFSAYADYPAGKAFAKMLADELGETPPDDELILPDIAERYEEARGRDELLARIGEVFGKEPTSIEAHRLLSRIKGIPYIVTTNYDRLFEIAFGDAIIPIASEQELPKAKGRGRGDHQTILYKLHGDVDHLDEAIITRTDYDRFDEQINNGAESLLWTRIRPIPAEHPIIFVGYSLDDPNTRAVLDRVLERLGPRETPYYIITLHKPEEGIEWYDKHNVKWIEKDAVEAIREIVDHVTHFSLYDAGDDSSQVNSCVPVLQERNVSVVTMVRDGKVIDWSFSPIDPTQPIAIRWVEFEPAAVEGQTGSNFYDFVSLDSFDPQHITLTRTLIEMNGILWAPPTPSIPQPINITLTRRPDEEFVVDLQVGANHRIPGVLAKRYRADNKGRVILSTKQFELTINVEKNKRSGDFTLKIHPSNDIETGRRIYSFFNEWVEGDSIVVLPTGGENRWSIPSFIQEDPSTCDTIRFWHRIYQDLSDIQKAIGRPLAMPDDGVTDAECQVIADAAELIRGERRIQGEIKVHLLAQVPDATKVLTDEPIDIECSHPDCAEAFELFGVPISLPVVVGGRGLVPSNLDDAMAEAANGAEKVTVIYDGSIGELYQRYLPPSGQNGDTEMTPP